MFIPESRVLTWGIHDYFFNKKGSFDQYSDTYACTVVLFTVISYPKCVGNIIVNSRYTKIINF